MATDTSSEERGDPVGVGAEAVGWLPSGWIWRMLRPAPSWLISMIVHMVVLIALALVSIPGAARDALRELLVISPGDTVQRLDDLAPNPSTGTSLDASTDEAIAIVAPPENEDAKVSPIEDVSAAPVAVQLSDVGFDKVPRNDLLTSVGAQGGDALSGRGERARKGLAIGKGGSAGSEQAVSRGLKWLAAHQMPDGGWSFAHHRAPKCHGQCRDPGTMEEARTAATALALLPFLGAGQTQSEGEYQKTVQSGLYFLLNRRNRKTGSLYEPMGSMYSHGIASIVLCEDYAMTHDKTLFEPAQSAVKFICYAQDPVGGGWRYEPRQPGDTSVLGWQLMALKSAHLAYLQVPPEVVRKAYAFLDSVQSESGAKYGYTTPAGDTLATTSIGLLCRMYLGWKKSEPALQRGVAWLSEQGPSENFYHNYYATQVMFHWQGEEWKRWNEAMRDRLVNSQSNSGHEAGSWHVSGDSHVRAGGRLYCTAMATMILEVYYRYMPIYSQSSTETEFPID